MSSEGPLRFYERERIKTAWSRARAQRLTNGPELTRYLGELGAHMRDIEAATFELDLDRELFAMAAHHENGKYARFIQHFFEVPGVGMDPALRGTDDIDSRLAPRDIFDLTAELGRILARGGAYSRGTEPSRALHLAVACAEELLGNQEGVAYVAHGAWCDFFYDIAWDYSLFVLVPSAKRVTVVCATDTD
jgi:hypothetical protein